VTGHAFRRAAVLALVAAALCLAAGAPARADGDAAAGEKLLAARCAGCHNLTGPSPGTAALLRARKGPDLFYAGNKYRPGWIEAWLQDPKRIRPAGMYYGDHVKATDKWDVVDETTLAPHVKLAKEDAEAAAAALMTRKAKADLLKGVKVEDASLSLVMGDLMFDKFKGCIACHQSAPDYGGFSGPELYTAARRLTPAYLYSYMKNPQAWDPAIWMPVMPLSDTDLNKLVKYLDLIAAESAKAGDAKEGE
jgi:mono/diheme cytochrome c family protein